MLRDLLLIGKNLPLCVFVGQLPDQTADAERLFGAACRGGAAGGSWFLAGIEKVLIGIDSLVMCFRRHNS